MFVTGLLRSQKLLSTDLEELVKYNNCEIKAVHQAITFTKNIENPFKKLVEFLYNERLKVKDLNPSLAECYKLILNSLYGKQCQKPPKKIYKVFNNKFEQIVEQNKKLKLSVDFDRVINAFKCADQLVLCEENQIADKSNELFGVLILSYSKRLMNEFMEKTNCFKQNNLFCSDTDSMYVRKSDALALMNSNPTGKDVTRGIYGKMLGQIKNDYKNGGILFAEFI